MTTRPPDPDVPRPLEPVPETRQALDELVTYGDTYGGQDLEAMLDVMARQVQALVPELVGLSVGPLRHGLTFTLASSSVAAAVLDATQYLDGGPCVEAAQTGGVVPAPPDDPLDEERWTMFSRAGSAEGIESSLSLPLYHDGELWGGVNLYAATPEAFDGHHDELAALLESPSAELITNADLSFATRLEAAAAPGRLRDRARVDTAVGLLAAQREISIEQAQHHLRDAAARAGVDEVEVARVILMIRGHEQPEE